MLKIISMEAKYMFLAIVSCKYSTSTLIRVVITLFHMLEIIIMEVKYTNYYLHCLFLAIVSFKYSTTILQIIFMVTSLFLLTEACLI